MSVTASGGSPEDPIFISVKVAAQRLGLKTWDVYDLVKRGELAHLPRTEREQIKIYAADLPRWAAEQVTKAAS